MGVKIHLDSEQLLAHCVCLPIEIVLHVYTYAAFFFFFHAVVNFVAPVSRPGLTPPPLREYYTIHLIQKKTKFIPCNVPRLLNFGLE